MKFITGFFMALGCFTTLPCPYKKWDEEARNHMLFSLPLIGLIIGVIWWALWLLLFKYLALPKLIAAAILAVVPMLLSGFIHVDGYMDCCDAIFSRRELAKRQQILKDSAVGAFACIGLALLMMFSFAGMHEAMAREELAPLFIIIPVLSRYMSAMAVWSYTAMRTSQYAALRSADGAGAAAGANGAGVAGGVGATVNGASGGIGATVNGASGGIGATVNGASGQPGRGADGTAVDSAPAGANGAGAAGGVGATVNGASGQSGGASRLRISGLCTVLALALIVVFYVVFDRQNLLKLLTPFDVILIIELAVHYIVCTLARRNLGGMNGDISGLAITTSEAAAVLAMALL